MGDSLPTFKVNDIVKFVATRTTLDGELIDGWFGVVWSVAGQRFDPPHVLVCFPLVNPKFGKEADLYTKFLAHGTQQEMDNWILEMELTR